MIDHKQAVQSALQKLFELVGGRELATSDVERIQLEELELTDDSKFWDVTLSYPIKRQEEEDVTRQVPEPLAKFITNGPRRKWRTLKIDSQNGSLVSMRRPGQQHDERPTS